MSLVFQSFGFMFSVLASFLLAMLEIVKLWIDARQLELFRHARNLPAIVFAVEFVGKEIKLGLQCIQILDWSGLPRLQLHFLYLGVQAHRFNRPSTLLQPLRRALGVSLVRKKEIVVKLGGVAQCFVQLLVGFRAFWAGI